MKKIALTTIIASILSCSLLIAEEATTQQAAQPAAPQCQKVTCGKMKDFKKIEAKAQRAVTMYNAKAKKANTRGLPQLAELYTNYANAQQKIADAAKAIIDCQKECKSSGKPMDMEQCKNLKASLSAAESEAAQADKALKDYKKSNKESHQDTQKAAPATTQSQP